jgi:DHA2 family multidrug resistance protein-like MFS transporter
MFRSRPFSLAAVAIVTSYGAYAGLLFLISQRLQLVEGESPLHAGITIVPFAVAIAAGGLVSPWLSQVLTPSQAAMTAMLLQAVSLVWLAAATGGTAVALVGMGLGTGIVAALAADLLMSSVPESKAGEAGAIQETAFALGAGIGVAILGTIAGLPGRDHATAGFASGYGLALTVAAIAVTVVGVSTGIGAAGGLRNCEPCSQTE